MTAIADYYTANYWTIMRLRAQMLRRLREFFDSRGFLEVETPILSADTVVDRHLDPFCTVVGNEFLATVGTTAPISPRADVPSTAKRLWLQTSPEFHMKRLLAAGSGPIYQVARVFRQEELGPLHNPEFTMIEWYQPGDGMNEGMQLTADLCETLLSIRHTPCAVSDRGNSPKDCCTHTSANGTRSVPDTERISYSGAFQQFVGIDPHTADTSELIAAVERLKIQPPESLSSEDRDGWLDLLMVERVQPHLGIDRPTLLYDYPASQAALARIRQDENSPPVAERFELFIDGIELANGYHELLDADELRGRNSRINAQRIADGKQPLPEESRLLAAMRAGLPPAVGVALGFDRLVMIAAGAKTVAEVMAFPFDRA
ncbi:MAG: EF-P lysine aminoacylase GenX [Pirellulaceae bacterium]|nr:EF-P lysine aminoacylase GenX [Pirellulaceae bacterium]